MAVRKFMDFLWTIYSLVVHGVDHAVLLSARARQKEPGPQHNILIVRLDAIGDSVLWLNAAQELRRMFPPALYRITLLGNGVWTSLAETLPHFDEVISLDRRWFYFHPLYRLRLLRKVRNKRFDTVIQPTFSREFLYGDSVVRFCGSTERIGSVGDTLIQRPFLKGISNRWYTRLVAASREQLMELERNAEFMRGLGRAGFKAGIPNLPIPRLAIPPLAGKIDRGYYVLSPGATVALRQWPAEFFAEIARRLSRETGWIGVVCGSACDRGFGEKICRLAEVPVQNLAGETSLADLVSVIAKARLLLGNETGAIHIAAAVSTPSACILGGGHFGRFVPYRSEEEIDRPLPVAVVHWMECFHCNWICIYHPKPGEPAPCVAKISVDAVWDAVRKLVPQPHDSESNIIG